MDHLNKIISNLHCSVLIGANFIELLSREFCLIAICFAKHYKTHYQPKYTHFMCTFGW